MEKSKAILSTALKLFVKYGFHGTPTSRIASESGVSNGALFHHFKTKDELVVALYVQIKEQLNTFLSNNLNEHDDIKNKFHSIFMHSIIWALENKDEFFFIQQFHFSPHLSLVPKEEIERQTLLHAGLLQEAVLAKILKPIPPELIGTLIASQIYGLHQYLLVTDLSPEDKKQLINTSFEMLLTMILK